MHPYHQVGDCVAQLKRYRDHFAIFTHWSHLAGAVIFKRRRKRSQLSPPSLLSSPDLSYPPPLSPPYFPHEEQLGFSARGDRSGHGGGGGVGGGEASEHGDEDRGRGPQLRRARQGARQRRTQGAGTVLKAHVIVRTQRWHHRDPHPLESLDHEVELAVVIGQKARDVPVKAAMDYVGGYALGLDMTAREIQSSAKSAGLPWTVAKGQDTFTPISQVLPKSMVKNPDDLELWLKVNDVLKQKGSTRDMIFKIPFLISHISSIMTLVEGDVILTGTPQGVGPVRVGDKVTAGITGLIDVHFDVQRRQKPSTV
uniref:Fumarylacetoacetase-like C-terminal domain-containing protein n=1 Tax=Ananas comosus var. bracteatus TaxID=296719 RepID=A0A6V7NTI2_ANACO|nr:unnamed protein product [Ananas comosus var. bracteatus]